MRLTGILGAHFLALCIFFIALGQSAFAGQGFDQWLNNFKQEAIQKGISQETLDSALGDIKPIQRVIELDRKQPEGTMTFAEYKRKVISQSRIDKGRALLKQHRTELDRAAKKYGVPPQYIVALWGIETSYGENTGGFSVIAALATLAYDGRRSAFFRSELLDALKIIDDGHITPETMRGSWAGAMGQNQFMPSSFHRFAVDGNGDGKRDIWASLPDVFASTANYLGTSGWKNSEKWGESVELTQEIPESITGIKNKKTLQQWKNMGIRLSGGRALPNAPGIKAALVRPDGAAGKAYLVYDNYGVIMTWNKSVYFATSVGLLADLIAQ